MKDREDFPQAARARAALQRQQGWVNLYILKKERQRQRPFDEWQSWNWKSQPFVVNIVVAVWKMARTTIRRMARSAMVGREINTVPLKHQFFFNSLAHS